MDKQFETGNKSLENRRFNYVRNHKKWHSDVEQKFQIPLDSSGNEHIILVILNCKIHSTSTFEYVKRPVPHTRMPDHFKINTVLSAGSGIS